MYVISDPLDGTPLDFDVDLLANNPRSMISMRPSTQDSWLDYMQTNRDMLLGVVGIGGATIVGVLFIF